MVLTSAEGSAWASGEATTGPHSGYGVTMEGCPGPWRGSMDSAQGKNMKVLSNTVGSFLTGSAIADAVMALNLALTRRRQVDVVDIPFIDSAGDQSRVQLAIGWHVELVTQTHAPRWRNCWSRKPLGTSPTGQRG